MKHLIFDSFDQMVKEAEEEVVAEQWERLWEKERERENGGPGAG